MVCEVKKISGRKWNVHRMIKSGKYACRHTTRYKFVGCYFLCYSVPFSKLPKYAKITSSIKKCRCLCGRRRWQAPDAAPEIMVEKWTHRVPQHPSASLRPGSFRAWSWLHGGTADEAATCNSSILTWGSRKGWSRCLGPLKHSTWEMSWSSRLLAAAWLSSGCGCHFGE